MRQHLGGLADQKQALESFAAVGGHHDQVAFVLFGGCDVEFSIFLIFKSKKTS
jgi:hypothetical protein